jgi:hypothetical protein
LPYKYRTQCQQKKRRGENREKNKKKGDGREKGRKEHGEA